jgi:hypothetical protein
LDDLRIVRGILEGPVVWARRRVGALTIVFAPSWDLAAALMPLAQSGESFGSVRRLIKLWRQQLRNDSPPGDASYLQKKSED